MWLSRVTPLLRLLGAGLVAQLCVGGGLVSLLALAGWLDGWFDILAAFAPIWLLVSLAGAALAWPCLSPGTREPALAIAAVGVAASLLMIGPEMVRSTAPAKAAEHLGAPLKLLTFNTWDENHRTPETAKAIQASGADVVALQEFFSLSYADIDKLKLVYPYWAGCPPGCDLVFMSKRPWLGPTPDAAATDANDFAVWATTTAPDGRAVTIVTTHLPWPVPPRRQAAARAELAHDVAGLPRTDLIVAGDFNLAPWTAALKRQDRAFAPLIRRTRALATWPAFAAALDAPAPFALLPIDQVYAGPAWRTLKVQRLPRAGSDHYGVLVTLARP